MDLAMRTTLDLDKICRVCLTVKKDMAPIFGEMVADMLMECARVQIDNTDGWPDKICIQCVYQINRFHAFKTRVEKSDQQLRDYIRSITVIVEEPLPKEMRLTQIELQRSSIQPHHQITHDISKNDIQQQPHHHHIQQPQQIHRQDIEMQRRKIQTKRSSDEQMILRNGQLYNTTAQIINGQIVTTTHGQPIIQTGQIVHKAQELQTDDTGQIIHQHGSPEQVGQIQRTDCESCEIIVQPDISDESQYYEDVTTIHEHHEHQIQEEEEEEAFTLAVSEESDQD